MRYLNEQGVDTSKLVARGYGQTKPLVADPFAGENRRVETRLRSRVTSAASVRWANSS